MAQAICNMAYFKLRTKFMEPSLQSIILKSTDWGKIAH